MQAGKRRKKEGVDRAREREREGAAKPNEEGRIGRPFQTVDNHYYYCFFFLLGDFGLCVARVLIRSYHVNGLTNCDSQAKAYNPYCIEWQYQSARTLRSAPISSDYGYMRVFSLVKFWL